MPDYKNIIEEYEERCIIYNSFDNEDAEELIRLTKKQAD